MSINNIAKSLVGLLFVARLLAGVPLHAQASNRNLACSCTAAACGNNAIGGNQGDIFTGLSQHTVDKSFKSNPNTGWTCVTPAKMRGSGGPLGCFCAVSCGNGGIGGDANYFDLGLSQTTVNKSYGGGKSGNPTGWLCGNYRGTYPPRSKKAKP